MVFQFVFNCQVSFFCTQSALLTGTDDGIYGEMCERLGSVKIPRLSQRKTNVQRFYLNSFNTAKSGILFKVFVFTILSTVPGMQ